MKWAHPWWAPVPVRFQRNLPFLNQAGSLGLKVRADTAPDVRAALAANAAFPVRPIALAEISAHSETLKPIQFGSGSQKAEFAAGASAGIGVFQNPNDVLRDLGPVEELLEAADFRVDPSENLLLAGVG